MSPGMSATGPAGLFGAGRDLGPAGCLGQDPWGRLHRAPPFPGAPSLGPLQGAVDRSSVASGAWGGLKAEADRERLEHESEKQRRLEAEKERKEREALEKAKEMDRCGNSMHTCTAKGPPLNEYLHPLLRELHPPRLSPTCSGNCHKTFYPPVFLSWES